MDLASPRILQPARCIAFAVRVDQCDRRFDGVLRQAALAQFDRDRSSSQSTLLMLRHCDIPCERLVVDQPDLGVAGQHGTRRVVRYTSAV